MPDDADYAQPPPPAPGKPLSAPPGIVRGKSAQPEEGIKLILEQILIAFILAFIFRAFVLEAFVIPTGSMATTLLGAHMRFTCPDCGWKFSVNYPTDALTNAAPSYARVTLNTPAGLQVLERTYSVRCSNCTYRLPRIDAGDQENDSTGPAVSYGDRILVLKHLYLFQRPERWDVVVFKNPSRFGAQYDGLPDWSTEPYQQNYIKRLIGLPGETVMLLDGDVYTTRADKLLSELTAQDFQIARKTDVAQSALWRVVYDDDHRPQGLARAYQTGQNLPLVDPPFVMPWKQADGAGWLAVPTGDGGGFAFDNADGAGTLAFDVEANPRSFAFTDYLTYDVTAQDQRKPRRGEAGRRTPLSPQEFADTFGQDFDADYIAAWGIQLNTVSDLRLAFHYHKTAGDGPLRVRLTKRGDAFEVTLTDGAVRVVGAAADGRPLFDRSDAFSGGFDQPRRVEIINAEYRLRVLIDGESVFETNDLEYAPNVQALLSAEETNAREPKPQVSITAERQTASLRHVSLWRDVYHTARDQLGHFNPLGHASPANFPDNVIRLGQGEYFPLGDNPFLSGDARSWTDRVSLPYENLDVDDGRVPERFMLGKAFFVYWPGSFRPGPGLPALVPNFGDMRFIR